MFITADTAGRITGRYANKQAGLNCIEVEKADLDAVQFPKWDKTKKKIVNDAAAQSAADQAAIDEAAYQYARARAQAYVQNFSKDPRQNPVDALGHVLDAILSKLIDNDPAPLNAIATKRAEIKAANPKA